jgi:hypothetical protein
MCNVPIFLVFVADDAGRIVQRATLHQKHLWNALLPVEPFSIPAKRKLEVPASSVGRNETAIRERFPRNVCLVLLLSEVVKFHLEDTMKLRLVLLTAAVAGGQVLGAPGAIVGGTVGAAVGAAAEIPNAFITSVERANAPSVVVRERVVVGERLPSSVQLRTVREYPNYRYAVVNDQRVIVEPRTRKIIHIIQ